MATHRMSAVAGNSVTCEAVTKCFGDERAVDELTLAVRSGSIYGLIGPSGGGKTTTIRLMTGVLGPDSGRVTALGRDPATLSARQRARLGYLQQTPALLPELSAWENLRFTAATNGLGLRKRQRLLQALELVELTEDRHKQTEELSGGMRRRLALAATLVHDPELLFLDEPTAGIDPILRERFWNRFGELRDEGRTLVVTTQYVGEARFCDEVGLIDQGRLVADGTPAELRRQAFGGEMIDLVTAAPMAQDLMERLVRSQGMDGVHWQRTDLRSVRLVVDDAGERMPHLMRWLDGEKIEVDTCEEHVPDFEEVFVALVRSAHGDVPDQGWAHGSVR